MKGRRIGSRRRGLALFGLASALCLFSSSVFSMPSRADEGWTGDLIMKEAFKRHELFPYVFEEQTMILTDDAGERDVRKMRRFSRVEEDGTVKYLLVFDKPSEVRGVALLAVREPSGRVKGGIYLPALGKELKSLTARGGTADFLGSDFAVEDLTAEILSDFRYVRLPDRKIDKIDYFVVDAFPLNEEIERTTGYGLRRHLIRQDIFFIVSTDYYDRRGRLVKTQTCHDLKQVHGDMWRANMILMENHKKRHQTLIKIDRRVFSHDYVPARIFEPAWLLENRHTESLERDLPGEMTRSSQEAGDGPPDDSLGRALEGR